MSFPLRFVNAAVFLCTLLVSAGAFAVPAAPDMHDLEQADGTTFKARRWGDEWGHGWETDRGYTILRDRTSGRWEYARLGANGALTSSSRVVGWDEPPEVEKRIRPSRVGDRRKGMYEPLPAEKAPAVSRALSAPSEAASAQQIPKTGTNRVPVILVNFSDRTPTNTKAEFDSLLFGTGVNSMKDFYTENSAGQFTVSGGTSGVMGWYSASNTHDYYGENNASGDDSWPGDLVYEAVQAADATVNFAEYDLDGDCYVDVVDIVHQGTGEEASPTESDIWSHSWSLSSAKYYGQSHYGTYTTNDPCAAGGFIKINKYVVEPERYGSGISTMGVFAHEYGHALGLPDLYDTDYSSEGDGKWTVMAGGSWNRVTRSGDRPAHFDAWSKYFLGWVAPTRLTTTAMGTAFNQVETGGTIYQVLNGTPQPATGEYFLLENRQKTGFDAGLPGAGLLVWHIDEAKTTNNSGCAPTTAGACAGTHYKVALLQADGNFSLETTTSNQGDAGDPFPGSSNRTSLTSATAPNNLLYSGSPSGFSLMNISPSSGAMTADVVFGALTQYALGIAVPGGSGSVTSSPAGINCGSTCSASFYNGQVVQLSAVPAGGYVFSSWTGSCVGTSPACSVTMDTARSVTANFVTAPCNAMVGGICYGTVAAAYAAATSGDTIRLYAGLGTGESLNLNRGIVITLAGGYDSDYQTRTGISTLAGVTVGTDTVTLDGIAER